MQSSCLLVLGLYRLELWNSSEAPQAGEAQLLWSCSCALPLFRCTALLDSCSKGQFLERDVIHDVVSDTALASPYRVIVKTGSRKHSLSPLFRKLGCPSLTAVSFGSCLEHPCLVLSAALLPAFAFLVGQAGASAGFGWWFRLETH